MVKKSDLRRGRIFYLGVIGIILNVNQKKPSSWNHRKLASSEIMVGLFLPHLCMLHAFWLIAGFHPPKMGTF
jgi:hypothetical protein